MAVTVPDVDTQFYQTLAGCQAVLQGFEQQSTTLKWWGVGLQTAGGLLGSVFLPMAVVAHRAPIVITALGSLAGFSNTEISVIKNEGLDAASVLMSRASVLAGMQSALTDYYSARSTIPLDLGKLQVASDKLKVACVSYYVASPNAAPIVPGP
ncbi:MAG: hypothetical protein ACYDAE_21595 [Steroidobacteraceae bacterium]